VEAQALGAPAPVFGMSLPRGFKARSYVRVTPPTVKLYLPFNRRYENVRPQGIASWLEPSDVRESVLWAREHEVPVATRSGGHNCAGYSTTEGLLIDRG
jgi:FAD/FMN-containing dehydrogenase